MSYAEILLRFVLQYVLVMMYAYNKDRLDTERSINTTTSIKVFAATFPRSSWSNVLEHREYKPAL